jgi:hypothetical protein
MTTRDSLGPIRLAAAMLALLAALATLVAAVVMIIHKPSNLGFGLTDVLVAPLLFVFYLGPALLLIGMASRSRTWKAAVAALVLAVLLSLLLEMMGITPWHYRRWQGSIAETNLVLNTLFFLWPGAILGGLIWLALNRKPSTDPETQ